MVPNQLAFWCEYVSLSSKWNALQYTTAPFTRAEYKDMSISMHNDIISKFSTVNIFRNDFQKVLRLRWYRHRWRNCFRIYHGQIFIETFLNARKIIFFVPWIEKFNLFIGFNRRERKSLWKLKQLLHSRVAIGQQ